MSSLSSNIPVVDLRDLASPQPELQKRGTDALHKAFSTYGLVYIQNHGIDTDELDAFYKAFLDFTARPTEEKEHLSIPDIWFQRGWTPPNTEKAVAAGGEPDFKECYFVAPEPFDEDATLHYPEIFAKNVWPDNADAFKNHYLNIGHQLHEVGLSLLRGCARALDLKPFTFETAVHGGAHVTRALRYIPLTAQQAQDGIIWGEEHTDFNLLTLLPGGRFLNPEGEKAPRPDEHGGLYLRTRPTADNPAGQMLPGKPPAGCIVAQVGQQLEILTGGTFLATPHVIKAPKVEGWSRVSMAHFVHLHPHQVLFPLDPFRNEATLKAYSPPVMAGTYGTKTLVDIGLAPAKTLNQFGYRHYERLETMREVEK